jgi:hypothetical protein
VLVLLLLLELLPPGDFSELLEPLGEVVVDASPEGAVLEGAGLGVYVEVELEPVDVVVSDERVPGEADGLVRSGVVVTRSVSVRLHAVRAPPTSARAQSPESTLFIADGLLVGLRPVGIRLQRPCPRQRAPLDSAGFIHYDCELRPESAAAPRPKEIVR